MVEKLQRPASTIKWLALHSARKSLKALLGAYRNEGLQERIMKNDNLNAILSELAENAAPTSRIDLWPTLKDRLATSESRLKQGDASMKIDSSRTLILRGAVLALMTLAIAFAILLAIPQGDGPGRRKCSCSLPSLKTNRSQSQPTGFPHSRNGNPCSNIYPAASTRGSHA